MIHSNGRISSNISSSGYDSSTPLTFRLLVQEMQRLARDPFLADRFRDGVDKVEGDAFRNFDFGQFVEKVGLQPLERLILASAIVAVQTKEGLHKQAVEVIHTHFDDACMALIHNPSFEHADLSPNQVAKLMANLMCDTSKGSPVLDATQREGLIATAQAKYGAEIVSPILQRILPTMR